MTSVPRISSDCSAQEPCAATTGPTTSSQVAQSNPSYFTFKDFLSDEDATTFFDWQHDRQVAKVTEYLEFVAKQPAAAHFTSSARASTSWAITNASRSPLCDDATAPVVPESTLEELLAGRTKSGFGAFGSETGFLPQKELSIAVAHSIKVIGHEYIVERNKKGEIRPPVLNSRSFYLNWCHAEKQKLMDIRLKLDRRVGKDTEQWRHRRSYWERVIVVVDRAMCADCIQFAQCLAAHEQAQIAVQDPCSLRLFPPDKAQQVTAIDVPGSL